MKKFKKKYVIAVAVIALVIILPLLFLFGRNDNDSSKTINAFFVDKTGNRCNSGNNIIAQFGSSQDGQITTFNTEVDADPHSASAGSYSGQVYFSMICE